MAIAEMFIWWYAHGWQTFIAQIRSGFASISDFFSIGSLFRTLFQPFRQISAVSGGASLDAKIQKLIDSLVSRFIGFSVRIILIFTGCITLLLGGIVSLVLVIIWPFIPLLPLAGIILTILGVAV